MALLNDTIEFEYGHHAETVLEVTLTQHKTFDLRAQDCEMNYTVASLTVDQAVHLAGWLMAKARESVAQEAKQ